MFKQLVDDRRFLIFVIILMLVFSFLAGYVTFRYMQVELCKSPVEVGNFSKVKVECESGC